MAGVWVAQQTGSALPLSHDWLHPDVRCLERGWRGDAHIFAGCRGALYETNVGAQVPLLDWQEVTSLPSDARDVQKIVMLPRARAIVLATGNGVWWSPFPTFGQPYTWKLAVRLPRGVYSGLARTTGDTLVAAAWPGFDQGKISPQDRQTGHYGLFALAIDEASGDLEAVRRNPPTGVSPRKMGRTSLASCATELSWVYAVSSDPANDNNIFCVLRSTDAGRTWTSRKIPFGASHLGYWANTIDVHPLDCRRVALGWAEGPFVSTTGGASWKHYQGDPHLHHDLHRVMFDRYDSTKQRLFVASDGGVAMTPDAGATWVTSYNRDLPILQFSGHPDRLGNYGYFTGRHGPLDVVGGGTQDNGNIYLDPSTGAWRPLGGGDGHLMMYVTGGELVHYHNMDPFSRQGDWNPQNHKFQNNAHISGAKRRDLICAPVTVPRVPQGSPMLAVGGKRFEVFGLFRGSYLFWRFLGRTGTTKEITGIGAYSGDKIFIGTYGAWLLAFDPSNGMHKALRIKANITGTRRQKSEIHQIVIPDENIGFATLNTPATGEGLILATTDFSTWTELGSFPKGLGMVYGLEADWQRSPKQLYAATDDGVYVSVTAGQTWKKESNGLPAVPHSSGLRRVRGPWLYLATFGRSTWRASLRTR
jgi:hypothetical protein